MHYVISTIGPIDRDHLTQVVLTYMRYVSYHPLGKVRAGGLGGNVRPTSYHGPAPSGQTPARFAGQFIAQPKPSPFGASAFGASLGSGLTTGALAVASARPDTRVSQSPPMVLQTGTAIAIQPNVRIQQVSDLGQTYQHLFFWDGVGRTQVLSVTAEGAHYEWARLHPDWNNPRFAFAPPADLRGYSAGRPPTGSAASLSLAEKLLKALWYALQLVPGDIKAIVSSMMEPENIGKLVLIETVYAASMFFGVGEVATLALVVWGVYCVGEQVITFIKDLQALVEALDKAQTEADLQGAGKKLAAVLVSGIDIARALFLRGKGSSANRPTVVVRAKAGNSGGKKPAKGKSEAKTPDSTPKTNPGSMLPRNEIDPKRTGHIFRKKEGHLDDTPANRQKLEDVANNPKTRLGTDKRGNEWYAETQPDGSQIWTQTRDGKIINGGVNKSPRPFNPDTGLSAPTAPGYSKP